MNPTQEQKNRELIFTVMLTDLFNAIFCFVMSGIAGLSSLDFGTRVIVCSFLLYIAIKDSLTSYVIYRYQ